MKADTRLFGKIDIEEDKIIHMQTGMIGFPDLKNFALIYDMEKEKKDSSIMWFQSMDEPQIAFPVMQPNGLKSDYNPTVNDEMLQPLGKLKETNIYVLTTVTATADKRNASINLKAPIIINTDTNKGCQVIVEDDYPVKYNIYDAIMSKKKAED